MIKKVSFLDLPTKFKQFKEDFHNDLDDLLNSGNFILGDAVQDLELRLAKYLGVNESIGVGNGTDALFLILRYYGIAKGDHVITTPMSYLASSSSIALNGATPIFSDVDASLNLCPLSIERNITAKTKAILVVHLAGNPANMVEIRRVADKYNLIIIEDCAQSFGAKLGDKYTGAYGNASAVSFHPLKNIGGLGDGGAVFTSDAKLSNWLRKARNHGHISRNDCEFWSVNSRLDALQAKFLQTQLKVYHLELNRRRKLADRYFKGLTKKLRFPALHKEAIPSFNWFVVLCDKREQLCRYLESQGIETKIHYPNLITQLTAAQAMSVEDTQIPNAVNYTKQILSLPIAEHITEADVDYVISKVNDFYR